MLTNPVEQFRAAAVAHGKGTDLGDTRAAGLAYFNQRDAIAELRRMPDQGVAVLRSLSSDPDPYVRYAAAVNLLPLDETTAVDVLEGVAKTMPSMTGLCAEVTLENWRAARLSPK